MWQVAHIFIQSILPKAISAKLPGAVTMALNYKQLSIFHSATRNFGPSISGGTNRAAAHPAVLPVPGPKKQFTIGRLRELMRYSFRSWALALLKQLSLPLLLL